MPRLYIGSSHGLLLSRRPDLGQVRHVMAAPAKAQPKQRVRSEAVATALPEPKHTGWWAALVYALCVLALAYPALSGQFLVNLRSDQYIAGYAFRDFAAQSLRAGHGFPQWNAFFF